MDNELILQKSWWKKNNPWFIPLIVVIIIAIGVIAKSGIADFAQGYADPSLYNNALAEARSNAKVAEIMGTLNPFDKMAMLEGSVRYTDNGTTVDLTIRVSGSKGSGKMDISAHKKAAVWEYKSISIRVKKPFYKKQTIPIIPKTE